MFIDSIEIRLLRLPLVRAFETSFGATAEREIVLVRVFGDGESGWGECVAGEQPFYSAETTVTAWYVIRDFLGPCVLGATVAHPREVLPALSHVRGHRMAKAAVEMAIWDLFARQRGVPLSQVLGGTRAEIASGVSVGIQPSIGDLLARIAEAVADGYQRVKVKIKPGWDTRVVAAVRDRFGDLPLMVDANAAYTLDDLPVIASLDGFGLLMIEQPLDEEDLHDHAALQGRLATPVCLDESIVSSHRVEEALAIGACRVVNIKPGRVGGHAESIRLHDACARRGVPVWHGGMLESGVGRAHNIHLASLPNFSLPGDIAASRRYFQPDLIEPEVTVRPDGTIAVPAGPGIGVEVVGERVARATRETLTLHA